MTLTLPDCLQDSDDAHAVRLLRRYYAPDVHPAPEPKPEYTRGRLLRAEVHPRLDTSCVADLLGSLLGGPSLDAGAGDGQAGHLRQT